MTTREFLLSAWNWHPAVMLGAAVAVLAYVFGWSYYGRKSEVRNPKKTLVLAPGGWYFAGALMVFLLTLDSPLNALADGYLFSAHMLQHLLLLLIVPLLALLSLPRLAAPPKAATRLRLAVDWVLNRRLVTWLAGVGAMWFWHVPSLCNAATNSRAIGGVQTVSLLLMGGVFWWPIAGPRLRQRLAPLPGVLYLFTACVGCTLLGIVITFSPVEVCSVYLHPVDRLGILPLIRNRWGMSPAVDQQVGGLLMWVPTCLIYLSASLTLLMRWLSGAEPEIQTAGEVRSQPSCP